MIIFLASGVNMGGGGAPTNAPGSRLPLLGVGSAILLAFLGVWA